MPERSPLVRVLASLPAGVSLPVAARRFAGAGVPVFPCAPGGKQPVTSHGFHDATTNLRQVEGWWARFPEANIGVPTGRASGSVVVDVDVHGVDGYTAFRRARRAGLVDGWEALVHSPTEGLHVYYLAGTGEQPSWQAGKAGVDFRGDRGYIIVPPSRRPVHGERRSYRVAAVSPNPGRVLDAGRLRQFLVPPRPTPRFTRPDRSAGREDAGRLAAWLSRQDTDRNLKLFWAACRLAEGNVPVTDALDALVTAQQPDFGEREITHTVHSAYRTIGAHPVHTAAADGPIRGMAAAAPETESAGIPMRGLS